MNMHDQIARMLMAVYRTEAAHDNEALTNIRPLNGCRHIATTRLSFDNAGRSLIAIARECALRQPRPINQSIVDR